MFGLSKFVVYTLEKDAAEALAAKQIEDDDRPYNPFHLTKQELAELDPNYKKPKKKVCTFNEYDLSISWVFHFLTVMYSHKVEQRIQ